MRPARRVILCIGAGLAWGLLARGLGAHQFGEAAWAAVIVSPLIGVAMGFVTHPWFMRAEGKVRWIVSLLTLYISGSLFALALGTYQFAVQGQPWERLIEAQLAIAWGITITGFFIVLLPLTYLTHRTLEVFEQR